MAHKESYNHTKVMEGSNLISRWDAFTFALCEKKRTSLLNFLENFHFPASGLKWLNVSSKAKILVVCITGMSETESNDIER
jgi:hypothetical protein